MFLFCSFVQSWLRALWIAAAVHDAVALMPLFGHRISEWIVSLPLVAMLHSSETRLPEVVHKPEASMMRIVLIAAFAALWTSGAMAQKTVTAGPCTTEEKRLCAGIAPGRDSLRACFRAHIKELSDQCLVSLARLSSLDKTCRASLNQECASVQPGEGRLEACLRSAVATLNDTCKGELVRALPGMR